MALIEAKNIGKIYRDNGVETTALKDISITINGGEFIAVTGQSGSGKSSLLHILSVLDKPTSGSLFFENKNIDNYSENEIARIRNKKMGFVFQSFNLLPKTTVLENVKLPLLYSGVREDLWDDMARKAIDSVGLSHRVNYDSYKLSGGERQRVAIARALVNNPEIIFADEPTGNLDSKSGQAIMSILQGLNEKNGHTIILVTHETYTAEHAERIIHISDGEIDSDRKNENRRKSDYFFK